MKIKVMCFVNLLFFPRYKKRFRHCWLQINVLWRIIWNLLELNVINFWWIYNLHICYPFQMLTNTFDWVFGNNIKFNWIYKKQTYLPSKSIVLHHCSDIIKLRSVVWWKRRTFRIKISGHLNYDQETVGVSTKGKFCEE